MSTEEMNVEKPAESKPYTLRPLCDEDLYPILDLIARLCPEDLKPIVKKAQAEFDRQMANTGEDASESDWKQIVGQVVNDIGIDIVVQLGIAVIKNMKTVKNEVYALLSDLSGIPAEQIRRMPFGTTPSMIWEVVKDIKNQSFFGESSRSS